MNTVTADQAITLLCKLRNDCFNLAGVGAVGKAETQRLLVAIGVLFEWAQHYSTWQPDVSRKNLAVAKEYLSTVWEHVRVSPDSENIRQQFDKLHKTIEDWAATISPPVTD